MKILFYADTVFGFGGVQRVLAVIAKALSDEHDVTILSTDTDVNLSMYGYGQSKVKFEYITYQGNRDLEFYFCKRFLVIPSLYTLLSKISLIKIQ